MPYLYVFLTSDFFLTPGAQFLGWHKTTDLPTINHVADIKQSSEVRQ